MTLVKICSITNLDDALAAVDAGADYLGFIGVPNTPRFVMPEEYAMIVDRLPDTVKPVVVVRNAVDARAYSPQFVQYYLDGNAFFANRVGLIRVIRTRGPEVIDEVAKIPKGHAALVVDAYHAEKLGGAGITANWDIARAIREKSPVPTWLAGGLTPANVGVAITKVRPALVDVSSGVEESPGRKDHDRVRAFIANVRAADTL